MKVLIVDDSRPIVMMVEQMLSDLGHSVLTANNGQEAIDVLKIDKDVELVLLDWNMPVMTGDEFLKENKKSNICKCPIVMMTTEKSHEKIQLALSLGATDYIMKPFTVDILQNKISYIE